MTNPNENCKGVSTVFSCDLLLCCVRSLHETNMCCVGSVWNLFHSLIISQCQRLSYMCVTTRRHHIPLLAAAASPRANSAARPPAVPSPMVQTHVPGASSPGMSRDRASAFCPATHGSCETTGRGGRCAHGGSQRTAYTCSLSSAPAPRRLAGTVGSGLSALPIASLGAFCCDAPCLSLLLCLGCDAPA